MSSAPVTESVDEKSDPPPSGRIRISEVERRESPRMRGGRLPMANARDLIKPPAPPMGRTTPPSAFERTVGAVRKVLPVVQKILPLLDGNVASAVANLLIAPRPGAASPELAPLERAIVRVHTDQQAMQKGMGEQKAALKRVEEQLDLVKNAAERQALEQKEFTDDLHRLRRRVGAFAWAGLVLLAISIGLNITLLVRVFHLPH